MSNRELGLNIHMTKKHATIEQLDGNDDAESECDESNPDCTESDDYDIEKDPNYVLRTYLSTTDNGRVVRTVWLPRGTPRWNNQILPFEPGHILH